MQVTAALLRRHVIAVVFFWVHLSSALLKNVTIDDSRGDELSGAVPAYVPDGGWTDQSTRYVTLDNSRLYLGTHHDTTAHAEDPTKQITFSFTGEYSCLIELPSIRLSISIGVALYIYCILANNPHPDTLPFDRLAQYKFFMDGQDAGSFRHDPDPNTQDYIYNALVFRADGLPNKQHDFKIQLDPSQAPVLILFDYAVYTVFEPDPTPSKPPPPPPPITSSTSVGSRPQATASSSTSQPPSSSQTSIPFNEATPSASSLPLAASSGSSPALLSSTSSSSDFSPIDITSGFQPTQTQGSPSGLGDTNTSTKPKKNTHLIAIIAGVLGGLALLSVILIGLWFTRSRRRRRQQLHRVSFTQPPNRRTRNLSIGSASVSNQSSIPNDSTQRLTVVSGVTHEKRPFTPTTTSMISVSRPSDMLRSTVSASVYSDPQTEDDGVAEEVRELRHELSVLRREQRRMRDIIYEPPPEYQG